MSINICICICSDVQRRSSGEGQGQRPLPEALIARKHHYVEYCEHVTRVSKTGVILDTRIRGPCSRAPLHTYLPWTRVVRADPDWYYEKRSTQLPTSHFYSATQCSRCKRCTSHSNSVRLSVCPSVRLFVTRWYFVKTIARSTVQIENVSSFV